MSALPPEADSRSHEWHVRSGGDGNKFIIAFDGGWLCRAGVSANERATVLPYPTC